VGRSFSGGVWGMLTSPARLKSSSKSEASEEDTTLRVKIEVFHPPPKHKKADRGFAHTQT